MIKKFHPASQRELSKPVLDIQVPRTGMVKLEISAKQWLEELRQGVAGLRGRALDQINQRRVAIYKDPANENQVRALCKHIYELAEIDRVDWNGASLAVKYTLIRNLVPFALFNALSNGVTKHHEDIQAQNWRMQWIIDDELRENEALKEEALQMTLDLYRNYIEHEGLTAKFQAYVAAYDPVSDGQATQ